MSFSFDSFLSKGKREKGKFSIKNRSKSLYVGKIRNEGTPKEIALRKLEIELKTYNFDSESKAKEYVKRLRHMDMIEFVNVIYFAAALYLINDVFIDFAKPIDEILEQEDIFNLPEFKNVVLPKLPVDSRDKTSAYVKNKIQIITYLIKIDTYYTNLKENIFEEEEEEELPDIDDIDEFSDVERSLVIQDEFVDTDIDDDVSVDEDFIDI